MKKFFLVLFMLLPITASAYDAEIDGIYYLFSGDEAIVTFRQYRNSDYKGDIVIPAQVTKDGNSYTVTRIGNSAFEDQNISSISLPTTITSIGDFAFSSTDVSKVVIPNSVKVIGINAFEYCKSLKDIYLSNRLTHLGSHAFYGCSGLVNINIPTSLQHVSRDPFGDCSSLKSDENGYIGSFFVRVPDKDATEINIKYGTKFVSLSAFEGCENLKSISIPSTVISVLEDGINEKTFAKVIEVVDNVKYIGPLLFGVTDKTLSSYKIREGTRYIAPYAFSDCKMTEISLPNTITHIGECAFYSSKLESLYIPKSVKHIEALGANNLREIVVSPENQCYDSRLNCNAIIDKSTNELVQGSANMVIPDDVRSIGMGAFFYLNKDELIIPNSVISINYAALNHCAQKKLYIPLSVKEISTGYVCVDNVYYNDYEFCNISRSGYSYEFYAKNIYVNGIEVKDAIIPEGITSIGGFSFSVEGINSVTIPSTTQSIDEYAFLEECKDFLKCYAEVPPFLNENSLCLLDKSIPLYVPASSIDAYKTAEGWKEFTNILPISVDVTDGDEYENTKEEGDQIINYTRTFANTNWQAIYVPFSMNYADWNRDFEVARINDAHQWDDDDDGTIDRTQLEVIKIKSGWTEPNTPYLIRAKSVGEKVITVKDATLYKTEENTFDVTSWNTKFCFTGTYKTISGTDMKANGYYAMSNGKLVQAASTSSDLKPFRWYLDVTDRDGNKKNVNEVKICVFGDDEEFETSVDLTTCVEKKHDDIYDLSGREVSNANKGIYVKNGKKYVVK